MHQRIEKWRLWPKLMSLFVGYMWLEFNDYFFAVSIDKHSEFALVQYAAITGVFVGFCKFYMDAGKQ